MIRNSVRIGLLFFAIVSSAAMFYYSKLETKSYNAIEDYTDAVKGFTLKDGRTVLITENANTGSAVVALGIIVGACLIGLAVLSNNDSDKTI